MARQGVITLSRGSAARSYLLALLSVIVAVAVFVIPAKPQTTASLSGTVTDTTGAILPGAKITLTNEGTRDTRQTQSNESGYFTFAGLYPGSYTVYISAQGFRDWQKTGVTVNPGDTRLLSGISLEVGGANQTVEVSAVGGEITPVDSGERSALLSYKDIERLAIQSRNLSELLKILPGVTTTANGVGNGTGFNFNDASSSGSAIGVGLNTNGAPYRGGTAYLLDGANIIDPGCACWSIAVVNPDMTQEVKVQTSNFGADSPQGPVIVNAISRSGTSKYHGQAYLYIRNGVLNSNTWQNNHANAPRAEDAYYYPGGSIGGPIRIPGTGFNKNNDKFFFWGGFEYFWQNLGTSTPLQSYVPTPAMRAGNFSPSDPANAALCANAGGFSGSQTNFCNNLAGTIAPDGTAITGTQIPAKYLDPGAQALLKLFPAANLDPTTNAAGYNYFFPTTAQHNGWVFRVRGDYVVTNRTRIYVSYQRGHDVSTSFAHIYFTPAYSILYPGGDLLSPVTSNVITGSLIHVFTPSITNELRIASGWLNNPFNATNRQALFSSTLGYPYSSVFPTSSEMVPSINAAGARSFPDISQPDIFQQGGNYPLNKKSPSVADDLTMVWRNHTFKVGGYWNRAGNLQGTYGYANGVLTFGSGLRLDAVTGKSIGSVNPLANFLMGITGAAGSNGFTQNQSNPITDMYYDTISGYFQDNWKVTKRLMLNLGLRLDHIGRWQDHSGTGLAVWIPSRYAADVSAGKTYPGIYWHAIDKSLPDGGSIVQSVFLSPRVGLAYDVFGTGKTIVRGGFGSYRWNDQYNDYAGPLQTALGARTFNSPSGKAITLSEIDAIGRAGSQQGSLASSVYATKWDDGEVANTYAYNFTISQQVLFNALFEIAYVGNHTQHLLMGGQSAGTGIGGSNFVNQNKIPLGGLFRPDPVTGAPAPADPENVPNIANYYPFHAGYGTNSISVNDHIGYSNYNGLQLSLLKQAGRLSFNVNYTYSKALGIVNSTVDAFNVAPNYGVLNIDRPHVLNTSYAFDIGNPYQGNKIMRGAVNGWTVSGITTWQAGGNLQALYQQNLGLTILNTSLHHTIGSSTYYGTPVQSVLPITTCNPTSNLAHNQKINLDCFTAPPIGQLGIRQAPYLSGPSYFDTDLAVYKTFHITEAQSIQFRASAFNFLNHPLPGFSSTDPLQIRLQTANNTSFSPQTSNATRGITDTKFGQRIMQFALKYSF
jgi:hypothetical protein